MSYPIHDLTGQRFGLVTALERVGLSSGTSLWKVRCDCGHERTVRACNLKNQPPRTHLSCGQPLARVESQARFALKDETGNVYLDWEVLSRRPNAGGNAQWLVRCETCGMHRVLAGIVLRSDPPSCRCHGERRGRARKAC